MLRRTKRTHDPVWSETDDQRVRVLLECGSASTPSIIADVIEHEGYDVRTCRGPDEQGCSLMDHGACDLVDGADVVVNMLRSREGGLEVLNRTLALRRPPAAVAELSLGELRRIESGDDDTPSIDTDRVAVVQPPVSRAQLLAAIRNALDRRDRTTPVNPMTPSS